MEDQNQDQNANPDQNANNGTNGADPTKTEKTVPYARFQAVNDAKKAAEEVLAGLVSELTDDIPEQYRSLVPNVAPAEQVKWIRNATKTGLFAARQEQSGPDSKRPGGKPGPDFSTMSATTKMANGYGK